MVRITFAIKIQMEMANLCASSIISMNFACISNSSSNNSNNAGDGNTVNYSFWARATATTTRQLRITADSA